MSEQHSHRHRHIVLDTGDYIEHEHPHTAADGEFNNLHHHPPMEHGSGSGERKD